MLKNKKVIILLIDSFGIGASEDAHKFGDQGSDTLGHIVDFRSSYKPLSLPNLAQRGLQKAAEMSRNSKLKTELSENLTIKNSKYGFCVEKSLGKDTPSGHWEIAGVPVNFIQHYFEKAQDKLSVFPEDFIKRWKDIAHLKEGVLDAGHSSGTEVIKSLGVEHCITKKPIIYTSADSVFQIAAHEEYFGLNRLYSICEIARKIFDDMKYVVGRVIARPFTGESASKYQRTGNRRDYSILPPEKTLLDFLKESGGNVVSVGKISDIYAHQGITQKIKATGIEALFDATIDSYKKSKPNTIIFTNFVDFDSSFGHRRDVKGYANALEYFDKRLPEINQIIDDDTAIVVTADHGCDPTFPGSDHTREHIPFLMWNNNMSSENIGMRKSFSDIGQSIAKYMGIKKLSNGESII